MNIFTHFEQKIKKSIEAVELKELDGLDLTRVSVDPPRDPSHGDLATNAAMVLAKQVGMAPRKLAELIVDKLAGDDEIQSTTIAGPGFINMVVRPNYWAAHLGVILREKSRYGRSQLGAGRKVNVEYVSANPTGPMHVGHCRGAVVGDALATLLNVAGFNVTREYYINDAGGQIDVLTKSVFLRYREALGENIGDIPDGLYPGNYLVPVGEALAAEHGNSLLDMPEDEWLPLIKPVAIGAMMTLIRDDLAALNVHQDVFFSERDLHRISGNGSLIDAAIEELQKRGFIYRGVLPPPKGQKDADWEDREQLLFRSTDVGDDVDRALVKSDGTYTYFAADVAYFYDKFRRGYDEMVFILGADHSGYVKRLEAVARAISGGKAKLTVRLCQFVNLLRDGEPVKMSKRSGNFITLREVVDEVGSDAVRFMMLYRKNDAPLDFDFAKVTEQSRQYAHARCYSVFRQVSREMPDLVTDSEALAAADFDLLNDEGELALIRKLAEFPRIVNAAAQTHEPHRVAFYLFDLASNFHSHWNRGKDHRELRFINPKTPELTLARLSLVEAIASVLASGLAIIGVSAPKEMR